MNLILSCLCDTVTQFTKPYNKMCAYQINQNVNRILFVEADSEISYETIDAIIAMIRDSKIAVVIFNCLNIQKCYIRKKMKERLFTEIEHELTGHYKDCLYFGQFNFGLIIDI